MYHDERHLDLYEWWARQWVGDARFKRFSDFEDIDDVVDLLSAEPNPDGL
jgi:hypothetical protein